jgi:hypothetical protein
VLSYWQPAAYFRRKAHAPFAVNFVKMKSFFAPTVVDLGEFYAQNNQVVFIAMFYITIMPSGMLLSVLGLIIRFLCDKNGLLRTWERLPQMDSSMVTTSFAHMELGVITAMLMGNRYFAGWPFDEVCEVKGGSNTSTPLFEYCLRDQDDFFYSPQPFMPEEQKLVVDVFKYSAWGLFAIAAVYYLLITSVFSIKALFIGTYSAEGEATDIKYTTVDEVQAYVPQIRYKGLGTPLLACDISLFDHEYIDWAGKYEEYDIFADARTDLKALHSHNPVMVASTTANLFSTCRIYPTEANPDPLNKQDSGDQGDGNLWVSVDSASGLMAADRNGLSDPYAVVNFDGMSWNTVVVHESLDPEWHEEFKLPIHDSKEKEVSAGKGKEPMQKGRVR